MYHIPIYIFQAIIKMPVLSRKYAKFQWRLCFHKYLLHQSSMVCRKRRLAVISNITKFLKAINLLPKNDVINLSWIESFTSIKTLEKIFTSCIQREQPNIRNLKFRKLKPQSVKIILNAVSTFIAFLIAQGILMSSDGKSLNRTLNSWKKYLMSRATPKQTPLLDMSLLKLKNKYQECLKILKESPESICDKKQSVEIRDACLAELCRLCGKRPHGMFCICLIFVFFNKKYTVGYDMCRKSRFTNLPT